MNQRLLEVTPVDGSGGAGGAEIHLIGADPYGADAAHTQSVERVERLIAA
jgi:hypothetical protein